MVEPDIMEVLTEEVAAMAATIERLEGANLELTGGSSSALAVMKAETIADLNADLERLLEQLQHAYQAAQD